MTSSNYHKKVQPCTAEMVSCVVQFPSLDWAQVTAPNELVIRIYGATGLFPPEPVVREGIGNDRER